jgi:hypothetical protein
LQSLREDDSGFLSRSGHEDLARQLYRDRKRIALSYLTYLEQEYQLLLELSRLLVKIAPEVSLLDEFQRFRLNVRFVLCCRYLGWKLRLGLQPWNSFTTLSDMEGNMTLQLEMATTQIGERAAIAADFPLFLEDRRRHSE